jgi:hypothetical protein
MYMYIHCMNMYMQCMYMVHIAHTGFNQLSLQVLVDNTEMQNREISHSPLLQGRIWMGAVPVQKMVIQVFDARLDTTETEEAISKSSVAWSVRSYLVLRA